LVEKAGSVCAHKEQENAHQQQIISCENLHKTHNAEHYFCGKTGSIEDMCVF